MTISEKNSLRKLVSDADISAASVWLQILEDYTSEYV